jgi:mannose-1-phosphate guanylyltransferase/mannose-6-phosphate isomerase
VAEFVEKPDPARAQAYVESGDYLWNAGIFVMRAAQVLAELEAAGPREAAIVEACRWLAAHASDPDAADEARERFAALDAVSIDVALMERSRNVAVIPAPLKWSDVGTLLALQDVTPADENGNVRVGRGIDLDSRDSIIYSSDRLVATLGVEDLIVVDTSDATLVAAKDRAQDVRLIFDALRAQGAEEIVQPKVALRPWGSWTTLLKGPGFQIKLLVIDAGKKPSLQRHEHRSEHWIVVEGEAVVTREHEEMVVRVNENAFIPAGMAHRVENRTSEPLKIIEVQVGGYLGDDDIVRLADDWGRE